MFRLSRNACHVQRSIAKVADDSQGEMKSQEEAGEIEHIECSCVTFQDKSALNYERTAFVVRTGEDWFGPCRIVSHLSQGSAENGYMNHEDQSAPRPTTISS